MTQPAKLRLSTAICAIACIAFGAAVMWLLTGCASPNRMAGFDQRVEQTHAEYLAFRSAHAGEFVDLDTRHHDWCVDFWWGHYLDDKARRGKPMWGGPTSGAPLGETDGIWATACGRWMIQDAADAEQGWAVDNQP